MIEITLQQAEESVARARATRAMSMEALGGTPKQMFERRRMGVPTGLRSRARSNLLLDRRRKVMLRMLLLARALILFTLAS